VEHPKLVQDDEEQNTGKEITDPQRGASMAETHHNKPGQTNPKHPICPTCGVPMWLVEYSPPKSSDGSPLQTFECKACGSKVTLPIHNF
jgi:hypothetical protein